MNAHPPHVHDTFAPFAFTGYHIHTTRDTSHTGHSHVHTQIPLTYITHTHTLSTIVNWNNFFSHTPAHCSTFIFTHTRTLEHIYIQPWEPEIRKKFFCFFLFARDEQGPVPCASTLQDGDSGKKIAVHLKLVSEQVVLRVCAPTKGVVRG